MAPVLISDAATHRLRSLASRASRSIHAMKALPMPRPCAPGTTARNCRYGPRSQPGRTTAAPASALSRSSARRGAPRLGCGKEAGERRRRIAIGRPRVYRGKRHSETPSILGRQRRDDQRAASRRHLIGRARERGGAHHGHHGSLVLCSSGGFGAAGDRSGPYRRAGCRSSRARRRVCRRRSAPTR